LLAEQIPVLVRNMYRQLNFATVLSNKFCNPMADKFVSRADSGIERNMYRQLNFATVLSNKICNPNADKFVSRADSGIGKKYVPSAKLWNQTQID
jgi:ribosome biogenesis protein Tsr3